jgi:hypothetical protein
MKITLYTNCFMHNDQKIMSVSLIVWRANDDATSVCVPGYVRSNGDIFKFAMDVCDVANGLRRVLTDCGHAVEVDETLKSSMTTDTALVEAYGRDL